MPVAARDNAKNGKTTITKVDILSTVTQAEHEIGLPQGVTTTFEGAALAFRVSVMADWRSEAAVFLHEYVEAMLCQRAGVSLEAIDAWDFAHPEAAEPGALEGCPYREAHAAAERLERQFCEALGLSWGQHSVTVDAAQ